jgi:hypothetical protein
MKRQNLLFSWAIALNQRLVAADVALMALDKGASGLSDMCVGMLNQVVNCEPTLLWATDVNKFYTDATLSTLCTSTCKNSLSSYVSRIQIACGSSRYDGGDGLSYLAAYQGQALLENYNMVCPTNA